jgi:hypothetical protein
VEERRIRQVRTNRLLGDHSTGSEHMRTLYAEHAQVSDSGEDITLLFGGEEADQCARIIMSPFSAKRLCLLLQSAVGDYEAESGLPYGPRGETAPVTNLLQVDTQDGETASRGEQGDRLIRIVRGLGVHYGIESSFKLFDGTVLSNRFLIGFKKETLRNDPGALLTAVCTGIGMPKICLGKFCEMLPEATIVLFGYEENGSNSVYKAYLEFGQHFEKVIRDNPREPAPLLIHLGFKWNTVQNDTYTTARYVCYPSFSVETIVEKLSSIFYADRHRPVFEIARSLIEIASPRTRPDEFLYAEVAEANNPRRSFDINMYRANLRMVDLYPLLSRIFRYYRIPDDIFHGLYDRVKLQIFGHLSGGIDREGRDFLTLYYGVKGSSR